MRHGDCVAFETTAKNQSCSLYLTHVKRSVQPNSHSTGQRPVHHKYHLCVCAKYDHRPQELSWSPLSKARVYRPRSSVSQFTPLGERVPNYVCCHLCLRRHLYTNNCAGNRSPLVVHANLPLSPAHTGRLVIIGDVHGCVLELAQLLKKVEFNRTTDKLVFVGDLCNKGPRSQQVSLCCDMCCQQKWLCYVA